MRRTRQVGHLRGPTVPSSPTDRVGCPAPGGMADPAPGMPGPTRVGCPASPRGLPARPRDAAQWTPPPGPRATRPSPHAVRVTGVQGVVTTRPTRHSSPTNRVGCWSHPNRGLLDTHTVGCRRTRRVGCRPHQPSGPPAPTRRTFVHDCGRRAGTNPHDPGDIPPTRDSRPARSCTGVRFAGVPAGHGPPAGLVPSRARAKARAQARTPATKPRARDPGHAAAPPPEGRRGRRATSASGRRTRDLRR